MFTYWHPDAATVPARDHQPRTMPHDVYRALSARGQAVCEGLQARSPNEEVARPVFGTGVEAWGWMHTEKGFVKNFQEPQLAKVAKL